MVAPLGDFHGFILGGFGVDGWIGLDSCEEGKEVKVDTEIRHVTKPGANLFLELGFETEEAERLQSVSRAQIDTTRVLKQQLMEALSGWIEEHHLKQAEAAGVGCDEWESGEV